MLTFATAVSLALVVSFLCSIMESVLLSIRTADVEALVLDGQRSGRLLRGFKRRIDVPIAAILILNTVAHTVGTAVAGASYENAFNDETLWIFTIVFTTAVLLFTEIIPKTIGVTHARKLAGPVAYSIQLLTVLLRPFVRLSELIFASATPRHGASGYVCGRDSLVGGPGAKRGCGRRAYGRNHRWGYSSWHFSLH